MPNFSATSLAITLAAEQLAQVGKVKIFSSIGFSSLKTTFYWKTAFKFFTNTSNAKMFKLT
jgi:hypothetical protein